MPSVLDGSCCRNKIPQMGGLTTDIYFLTVLKAGNPRSASNEGPLPGLPMTASSLCPHGVESSLVSFLIRR